MRYLREINTRQFPKPIQSTYVAMISMKYFQRHRQQLQIVSNMVSFCEMICSYDRFEIDLDATIAGIDMEVMKFAMLESAALTLQNENPDFTVVYTVEQASTPTRYNARAVSILTVDLDKSGDYRP